MISAADSCGQVVGGNYDVVLIADTSDSAINDQSHQQQPQSQRQQQQQQQINGQQQVASDINHNQINAQDNSMFTTNYNNKSQQTNQDQCQNQHQNYYQQQQQHQIQQQEQEQEHHQQQQLTSRPGSSPSASSSSGSAVPHFGRALTNYLERFEQLELELEQAIHAGLLANCGYANEFRLLKEFSKQLRQNKDNLREGEMDINQIKNRYKDILPFSHTRVSLLQDLNIPGSDYINANYIRGASGSPQAYIACQGPLPGTLTDFWRMIWECRVSVLVMACNEFESGKSKCEIYWPHELDTSIYFGPFEIRLLRVRQICQDFLVRKFSIKLLKHHPNQQLQQPPPINNNLNIGHCGSQVSMQQQNNLTRPFPIQANSASASSQSSSISSASSLTNNHNNNTNSTNCCHNGDCSSQLRIQNGQQQQVNQTAAYDAGITNVNGQFLRPSEVAYQHNSSATTTTTTSLPQTNSTAGDRLVLDANNNSIDNNLKPNILYKTNNTNDSNQQRPQLQYCHQLHPTNHTHNNLNLNVNSDNIGTNNSVKMKISPVQETTTTQSSWINDNNQEARQQSSVISATNLTGSPNNLQEMDEGETRIICQFHYTTWPDHGAPRSMQPILEMVRLMREVQPAEDRPILVHCSAGCGRTGTICCIDYVWGLLRRGELDPSFDLCSIISEMRQQRMAMVQTLEQYILCHRAVAALFIDQLKLIDDHTYENLDDLGPLDAVEAANRAEPSTLTGSDVNNCIDNNQRHGNMQSYNSDDINHHNEHEDEDDDDHDNQAFSMGDDDNLGPVFI